MKADIENEQEQPVELPFAETEAALIAKAQKGDRYAYGELVRRHHPGVLSAVYRMCGDVQLAEDAAQDAFIQAWLHLSDFRPGTSLRNWLYRIAVNASLDDIRRAPAETGVDIENLAMPDPRLGPEAAFTQKERSLIVQQAIVSLPRASRSVLVLREYCGLSYQEIATALDIPLGTVMSRLNYARENLKHLLAPHFTNMELENV